MCSPVPCFTFKWFVFFYPSVPLSCHEVFFIVIAWFYVLFSVSVFPGARGFVVEMDYLFLIFSTTALTHAKDIDKETTINCIQ